MEPECEVNKKSTREKNDDNEISSLHENGRIESTRMKALLPKTSTTYNRYGDDFLIDSRTRLGQRW